MQETADGEHTGPGGAQSPVDGGATRVRVQYQAPPPGEFVVGHEVTGEHDGVAGELGGTTVPVPDADAGQPSVAEEFGDGGVGEERYPVPEAGVLGAGRCRLGAARLADHGDDFGSGGAHGVGGGVGHVLGTDDDGPGADPLPVQMHRLLQLPCRVYPFGPGPRHETGRTGSLTCTGGEYDGCGPHGLRTLRTDGVEGERSGPVEGRDPGTDDGTGTDGGVADQAGVGGSGERMRPGAEAAVVAVSGHSPGVLFPVQHLDTCDTGGGEAHGGGEPCGSGTDDEDVDLARGAGHVPAPSINSRTAAPQ